MDRDQRPVADRCVRVPDDDPRLRGAPLGMCQLTDGVFYVAESDWLMFLAKVADRVLGPGAGAELRRQLTH